MQASLSTRTAIAPQPSLSLTGLSPPPSMRHSSFSRSFPSPSPRFGPRIRRLPFLRPAKGRSGGARQSRFPNVLELLGFPFYHLIQRVRKATYDPIANSN